MKKLILNICTLMVTTALLIVVCLAWYTSNKNVSANGIIASTLGEEYTLKLQRGTKDTSGNWHWVNTDSLSFVNLNPGNVFYFRIVIDAPANSSFSATVSFDRVSSELQSDRLVVEDNYICKRVNNSSSTASSNNVKLYKITDNKVFVDLNGSNKVLYNIDNTSISLGELKIEDVFRFYKFTNESDITTVLPEESSPLYIKNVKVTYDNLIPKTDTDGRSYSYLYFALEFNDEDSLALIDGIKSSNAYLYQKLIIGAISVTTNKNENASNNGN